MQANQQLNNADAILVQIEKLSQKHFLPIIGPVKGELLADEVRKAKPKRVIEVGTLIGYSAILMGKEMDAGAEIFTIEIHADEAELAEANIHRAAIKPKVKVLTGNAIQIIPTLRGPFQFAFIDAEKDEYFRYLSLMENKLEPGAVVFADNAGVFADQMADYLNYVRNSTKYRSRYVQVGGDGVEISVKV